MKFAFSIKTKEAQITMSKNNKKESFYCIHQNQLKQPFALVCLILNNIIPAALKTNFCFLMKTNFQPILTLIVSKEELLGDPILDQYCISLPEQLSEQQQLPVIQNRAWWEKNE